MTAASFAELIQARPTGRGRWQTRCPAHPDNSPSLTIREGADGRVLLHCFAGCPTSAILAALGLTMRDLFSDAPVDPGAREKVRREALERHAAEREKARVERRVGDIHRRIGYAADSLGARLARAPEPPEGDAPAAVLRPACRMQCEVETRVGGHGWVKVPLATVNPPWSPFLKPDAEAIEAGRVSTEAQLLRYVGTGIAEPISEQTTQGPRERALLKECA